MRLCMSSSARLELGTQQDVHSGFATAYNERRLMRPTVILSQYQGVDFFLYRKGELRPFPLPLVANHSITSLTLSQQ